MGTFWKDPVAPSVFLLAITLLLCSFSLVALFSNRLFKQSKYLSLIAATFVGLLVSTSVLYIVFGPLLPYANVSCPEYRLLISVDEDGEIDARQRLTLSMKWKDEGDIVRNDQGNIAPWQEQKKIAEYLNSEGYGKWDIAEMLIVPATEQSTYTVTVILEKLERNIPKIKNGLIRYLVEIYTNKHVYGSGPGRAQSVVLIIETPKDFSLVHNLNGSFSEMVLDSGAIGKRLVADKILSYGGHTVRLSFISPEFQNPALNWLSGFSAWTIFTFLGSILLGVVVYFLSVFLDVFKDESVKPVAVKVLRRIGLISKLKTDTATTAGRREDSK